MKKQKVLLASLSLIKKSQCVCVGGGGGGLGGDDGQVGDDVCVASFTDSPHRRGLAGRMWGCLRCK